MAASQNGWSANDRTVIASYDLPGGRVALRRGPAGQVLAYVGRRWHTEVEALQWPGCWGYAERPIRGGTALSNHASGTALDLCAPRHPLGTNPAANFSAGQIAAVHRIVGDCGGLIRWGGDYTGRKDGMHVEVNDGVTEAQLAALWARLSGTTPTPPPVPAGHPTLQHGSTGPEVVGLQKLLATRYPVYAHGCGALPATGNFLTVTDCWVREFQRRSGLAADGIVGPRTWAALGL